MHLELTPEQEELRQTLRTYFAGLMTPEVRAAVSPYDGEYGDGSTYKQVVRQLGKDGWLTLSWPVEYGGKGATAMEQLIFMDEAALAGVPVPFLTINTVGPTIMRFGTEEQKQFYLPKIASGEIHFAIGYSEPEAGTDLASLRTKAVRDEDGYVINGQKMWTSLIQYADYVWLAARTDPEAQRHKGLSILIVPTAAEGFSWTPVPTVSGPVTSATYYSDVRVPHDALIGEEHKGWALITNQLNHERVALTSAAPIIGSLASVREWAQNTKLPDGRRVIDQEWVQVHLARVHAKSEFLRLINWKIAWASTKGSVHPADASSTKVFGTEFYLEAFRLLMEILGQRAYLRDDAPGVELQARLEHQYRGLIILTFGGGPNEILRDLIAVFGLGMPLAPR